MRLEEIQVYKKDDMQKGVKHFRSLVDGTKILRFYLNPGQTEELVAEIWFQKDSDEANAASGNYPGIPQGSYYGKIFSRGMANEAGIEQGTAVRLGTNRFAASEWAKKNLGHSRYKLEDRG